MKTVILSFLLSLSIGATFTSNPPERFLNILNTGDGKTAETAYKVYSISEEYELLKHLNLKPHMQLLAIIDGHLYDILQVGETYVYFKLVSNPRVTGV